MQTDIANTLFEKMFENLTEHSVEARLEVMTRGSGRRPSRYSAGVAHEAPLEDMALLEFSIVNMKEAIGRGW